MLKNRFFPTLKNTQMVMFTTLKKTNLAAGNLKTFKVGTTLKKTNLAADNLK